MPITGLLLREPNGRRVATWAHLNAKRLTPGRVRRYKLSSRKLGKQTYRAGSEVYGLHPTFADGRLAWSTANTKET